MRRPQSATLVDDIRFKSEHRKYGKKWHTIYLHWYTRTLSVPLSAMHAVGRIYAPSKDIIQLYCEWDMIDR